MTLFHYRARDRTGALVQGDVDTSSVDELKENLSHQGLIPLKVEPVHSGFWSLAWFTRLFQRVKPEELMVFTRQFHTLFRAGVSMDTILGTMVKQLPKGTLRNALMQIRTDIGSGATLAQSFRRHPNVFNELYCSMLAAGEEAGILDHVLKNLSQLLQKEDEIHRGVKGAVLYPKIIVTVLVGATTFLMIFVVPRFVSFYAHYKAELPLPTKIVIAISNFVVHEWYLALGIMVLGVFLYHRFASTNVGRLRIDRLRFRFPVFGELHLKVANARFGHIMAALYGSGLALPRALEVVANVIGNRAYAQEVIKVRDHIQKGSTLSEAMASQLYFSPVMIETTAVGERAGALDELLATVAEHYELEVQHMIKNLTTLLEPLLLVGIFGMVLTLALAIFLPIWNLTSVIRR
ncbi:MAG: type II secretion system F family protein [Deltaproteobacteria bacterium]|nr:type II secretion system F family protein [Deltaproteobacteria bacterium]